MQSIGERMAKGAAWMVLFKLLERGLGLASTIVLARLLVPADFGIVAMAVSMIAVLELLSAFSLDVALIQKQNLTRDHYDTAWTLNLLANALIALLAMLIAAPAADFFAEPRVEWVIYGLAAAISLQGFENIGIVAFRKELALDREFRFLLMKKLVAVTVSITLAVMLRSYWALVAGSIAGRIAGVALSYLVHPYRPRLSLAARHELLGFSKWLFLNNLLVVANQRAADFILGRLAGPAALGVYNVGYEIANLPTTELAAPINRAVFPGYTRMAGNRESLKGGFLAVVAAIALVAIPAAAGVAALATELVRVLLGEQWLECIPIIQILAIHGVVTALQTNAGYVFIATGSPSTTTRLATLRLAILVPSLLVGTSLGGSVGAAWGALGSTLAMLPFNYAAIFRSLDLRPSDYAPILWRPLVSVGCMLLAITIWRQSLTSIGPIAGSHLTILLTTIVVGALSYTITAFLLWHFAGRPIGTESHVVSAVKARLPWSRVRQESGASKAE
jgi:O-antigen/teichoic acid export membrane protein